MVRKYKDGKKEGHWTAWHESGQKEFEGNYVDGELVK
jgi:antitoxin component YwqK of YwqJK toxin-antitoxin module